MERFWLKHYPAGVPADVDASQYRSVAELMEEAFRKYSTRDAYVSMGKSLTFGEVDEFSRNLGAWLQSRGLSKGARVALMMPNVLQYPVAIAGVLRAGYVVVNVNPLYTPRELSHQLIDSGAEAIVILENFAATLEQVIEKTQVKHVVVASMGDLFGMLKGTVVNFVVRNVKKMVPAYTLADAIRFNTALTEGARMQLTPSSAGHEDPAFLQYTGGTTGVSKGATLVHRNMIANVLQSEAWMQPALQNPKKPPPPEQTVTVCALPLYHIFRPHGLLPPWHAHRRQEHPHSESAGPAGGRGGTQASQDRDIPGRQHALQRTSRERGLHQARFFRAAGVQRWRDGGAEGGGREVAQAYRLPDLRRLRVVRNLPIDHLQPDRYGRLLGHHRPAVAFDRNPHPG
jgi:hypothetical protein